MPSIFPLPPQGDQAADLVLYFGGDDDAGSAEIDMIASERMYERGLPYHMNLMPTEDGKGFVITREEADLICSRGQEISIHYNFLSYPYTPEGWKTQHDLYLAAFGQPAISPVNHCLVQTGSSAERCRLAKEQGRGAVALRGKMIDAPIVARARQTIEAAEQLGLGGKKHEE